jgi:hypothetical protein
MRLDDPATAPDRIFGLRPATLRLLAGLGIAALLAAIAFELAGLTGLPGRSGAEYSDFDMFHTVARLALAGRLAEAYDLQAMLAAQIELGGVPRPMTWTYPPPFDLLLAPLGWLGRDAAYLLFAGGGLALYLAALARLAGPYFGLALVGALPAALMSVRTGQNGCRTGALIALACLAALRGREGRAGLPLGLLAIKPHLGVGLGLWALAAGRGRLLVATCLAAAAACAAATAAFGPAIWGVFLGAVGEAGAQLEAGAYRAHRMASLHAALTSLGLPHGAAAALQAAAALLAALAVALAARGRAARPALAVALTATPLFGPYLYDYDLALYGPALALLLPELDAAGRRWLALPAIGLVWIAGGTGLVQNTRGAEDGIVASTTGAGIAAAALAALTFLALRPRRAPATAAAGAPAASG